MNIRICVVFCLVLSHFFSLSQSIHTKLELREIMSGNDFIGQQPEQPFWNNNSTQFYFEWDHDNSGKSSSFVYDLKSDTYSELDESKALTLPTEGYISSNNREHHYFKKGTKLFRLSSSINLVFNYHQSYQIVQVLNSGALILRISDELIEYHPANGTFLQLVKITSPESGSRDTTFLETQQSELFDFIQKKQEKSKPEDASDLPEIDLENNLDWISFTDNKHFALYELTEYPKNTQTEYASYVSEDGYTQINKARPKVGSKDPKHVLFLLDLQSNIPSKIDISSLSGIDQQPDYLKYYPNNSYPEGNKNVIYHAHGANSTGDAFLIEIKSYDNKDRWLTIVHSDGALQELDHQHDTAWVGGPGISGWNTVAGNAGWIDDQNIYFQSEETGYSHLYQYNIKTKQKTALTSGFFEIHEAILSKNKDKFFITANKKHPGNREFYVLAIDSKSLIPILTMDGNHEASVSPDEKMIALRYSAKNKPWEIYLAPLKEKSTLKQITQSTSIAFNEYDWCSPKVVTIKANDGALVYARLYEPDSAVKNNAGVLFVHGAGYLQNAHNWWSTYYREYMFHNLLADKGYTVLDIDYRGSEGYGRDWRTAIYRNMGGKDLSDQLDGRKYLIEEMGIDPNRIGIYGGSYGGFITLMALLKNPGKFKCAAALRSVTDWAHYNHPYTSNILNTPENDPEAFKRSSPIYYAQELNDRLLMLHGMIDDNVQYQDVVRLSQRFIELGKTQWDLIGYPVEPHGFKETSSWTDEYRRILNLFEEELN